MTFQVSARKYRPQRFDTVLGQEHVTVTIKNAIVKGRVAHAYLLTGPRGVGKTTTARIIAKSVNCLNSTDGEPCNECTSCKAISSGQSIDLIEIDAASNRGIDDVRQLTSSVHYTAANAKYKVYIIDEVHMLTKESFNAFLKTLEEPPENTIFIFATTDVHKVPITIISRCQRYDFRRIPLDIIKAGLREIAEKENFTIDDKTLTLIAKKADGGMRDAESFFDQAVAFSGEVVEYASVIKVFNFIDEDIYFEVTDALLKKDFKMPFLVCDRVYKNGWSFIDFFNGLQEHFRNILSVAATSDTSLLESSVVYYEQYKALAKNFSEGDLLRIMNYLSRLLTELRYSQNHKLRSELALSQLTGFETSETISNLIDILANSTVGEFEIKGKAGSGLGEPEAKEGAAGIVDGSGVSGNADGSGGSFRPADASMQPNVKADETGTVTQSAQPAEPGSGAQIKSVSSAGAKTDAAAQNTQSAESDSGAQINAVSSVESETATSDTDNNTAATVQKPQGRKNSYENESQFFASYARKKPAPVPKKPETNPYIRYIIDELGGKELEM
ncbi:MAG: DNA polymerase III subunit gamma/tau [Ignavibacteriales bacterium]|nr:MAG: DNA polymerase III subunit gamma/tau [Ignavibacteriaceae bacterium]MBW7873855.1 DNA polymerase III subunit gamma/tau [Ignavibacteria bacterium]MCZ2144192.1 DNA polymerase III subunit gamma/tau [Ignavibacteriales bacterium]OQY76396.1 MAG: hypothetical protein B6D45_03605 [Ignavibacteriales bacterium UTCHB3]MBV6445831.1 Holliday junction ATP-dependent DNA helicase RuvB [Ignavibacteriaceae bacterium]